MIELFAVCCSAVVSWFLFGLIGPMHSELFALAGVAITPQMLLTLVIAGIVFRAVK